MEIPGHFRTNYKKVMGFQDITGQKDKTKSSTISTKRGIAHERMNALLSNIISWKKWEKKNNTFIINTKDLSG